jgi:uncharacterized protein YegP (UPF0339 family)/large-conductance mechanosensitive channel
LLKFQVYKDSAGKFRFRLRAENSEIVAIGEAYEKLASCLNGIKSIQKNCNAKVEDTTVEGQRLLNPKFQIYKDVADKFRFKLYAKNGEIIAGSEAYETKDACLNGIKVVGQSCDAEIEDLTQTKEANTFETENAMPKSEKQEITTVTSTSETQASKVDIEVESKVTTMDKEDEILAELKKISAALEKAPPPVPPKGFVNEFKDFLSKYKILGLAVAFILALYLGILVQALVKDFVIPLLGLLIPGMSNLSTYAVLVLGQTFGIGEFLVALITFIAVALIVFIVVKAAKRMKIE